jgi:LysM repeat protein
MFQIKNLSMNKASFWLVESRYAFSSTDSSLDVIHIKHGETRAEIAIQETEVSLLTNGDESVSVEGRAKTSRYTIQAGDVFSVMGTRFQLIDPKYKALNPSSTDTLSVDQTMVLVPDRTDLESLIVDGEKTIGRSKGSDFVLTGARLSREHARITVRDATYWIEDLESVNGTFVNGVRVSAQALKLGDKVSFAEHAYRVALQDEGDLDKTKARPVLRAQAEQNITQRVSSDSDTVSDDNQAGLKQTHVGLESFGEKNEPGRTSNRLGVWLIITLALVLVASWFFWQ